MILIRNSYKAALKLARGNRKRILKVGPKEYLVLRLKKNSR